MAHNLFGVTACWVHGCQLVFSDRQLWHRGVLHDAESTIPESLQHGDAADETDVLLARDMATLFGPNCPRPGRRRIAAALRRRAKTLGLALDERRLDNNGIKEAIRKNYSSQWLASHGVTFGPGSTTWGRSAMLANAAVYPAITTALLARALDLPLPELLAEAIQEQQLMTSTPARSKRFSEAKPRTVERSRAVILALRKKSPHITRTELSKAALYATRVLSHYDPIWLEANLPARVCAGERSAQRWAKMDEAAAAEVARQETQIRSVAAKPRRITEELLRAAVGQLGRKGDKWKLKLPQFHKALASAIETKTQYAQRRIAWMNGEV